MTRFSLFLLWILTPSFSFAFQAPVAPADVPAGSTQTVEYFPIVAIGGGNSALFTLFNFGDEQQVISLSIVTDQGESVFSGGSSLPGKATSTRDLSETLAGLDLSEPRRFWIRATSNGTFSSGGLQTLQVAGQTLLPYGVLASPACRRMTLVLNETDTLRSAVALLNPGSLESSCQLSAYRGIQGEIASAEISLPGFEVSSFFLNDELNYGPNFQGAVEIVCTQPAAGYSLLQDSSTGNTSAVSVECVDTPLP